MDPFVDDLPADIPLADLRAQASAAIDDEDDLPPQPIAAGQTRKQKGMGKRRRVTVVTARKRKYVESIRQGARVGVACAGIGVSRQTIKRWRDEDPRFAADELQAELDACEMVEDALFQAATSGNVTAALVWLFNRRPERWADKRNVAITGAKGGPIQVEATDSIDAEVKRLIDRIERNATKEATPTP